MKQSILQLLIFLLLSGCNQSSNNQPSIWKVEEKKILFGSHFLLPGSEIMAKLQGECAGNQFEPTDKAIENSNQGRVSYIIDSWQQLKRFRKAYFHSAYFEKVPEKFFNQNRLGVVFVVYTGSTFINNEKLYCDNKECGFSYEVWDREMKEIPACVWTTLYLVKLNEKE